MTPATEHPDGPAGQPLRSDAERNRERITVAARKVFARDGLGASMASVAREAGVEIATMFRRFPTKEELVDAVFIDRMGAYADAGAVALEDPDPWNGFVGYIETACAMQAADSCFADVGVVNATGDAAPTPGAALSPCSSSLSRPPARGTLPASTEHDAPYRAMLRAGPAADAAPDARTN